MNKYLLIGLILATMAISASAVLGGINQGALGYSNIGCLFENEYKDATGCHPCIPNGNCKTCATGLACTSCLYNFYLTTLGTCVSKGNCATATPATPVGDDVTGTCIAAPLSGGGGSGSNHIQTGLSNTVKGGINQVGIAAGTQCNYSSYFINASGVCQVCHANGACWSCKGPATNECSACQHGYYLTIVGSDATNGQWGSCAQSCATPTPVADNVTGTCIAAPLSSGPSHKQTGLAITVYGGTNQSGIGAGSQCTFSSYYVDGAGACQVCHANSACWACKGPAANECSACQFGYYLTIVGSDGTNGPWGSCAQSCVAPQTPNNLFGVCL